MKKLSTLLLAGSLMCAAASWAVPAKRVQHTVYQPDGSALSLTLTGDEYCHYFVTDDGQPVLKAADGSYRFATAGVDGALAASSIMASNAANRTAEQTQFLNSLSTSEIEEAIATTRALSPLRQASAESRSASAEDVAGVGLNSTKKHPTTGNVKALVVLVAYSDVSFSKSDEEIHAYFSNMLNEEGFTGEGATGSAYDYFTAASSGTFTPQFDVVGPVVLPSTRKYYGGNNSAGNDTHAHEMVVDMANAMIAQGFDFSPYDNNGDGIVDNVFIFYAGVGEAQTSLDEAIWPHQSSLAAYYWPRRGLKVADNLYLDSYACSSELNDASGSKLDGIGTFVHEYSHVLGLPDLYNTTNSYVYYTPGKYSVLDQGPYNNDSRTPPTYSAYERNALGWISLTKIEPQSQITLENLQSSNQAYVITTDSSDEFFLLENRQKNGWDQYLPGKGMLVWHIHYVKKVFDNNTVNNDGSHQYVDIVEANGRTSSSAVIQAGYPFPGSSKVYTLDYPQLATWAGEDLGLPITGIAEANGVITAKVGGENAGISSAIADGSQLKVTVSGRTISVEDADPATVVIYDSMGRRVQGANVAPGMYIVTTPAGTAKVAVR